MPTEYSSAFQTDILDDLGHPNMNYQDELGHLDSIPQEQVNPRMHYISLK